MLNLIGTRIKPFEGHDIGVIAQEVEKVAPEIVVTRDDGYKAVNYQKLTALLIEAVKELKEEIKELKRQITPTIEESLLPRKFNP